MSDTYERTIEVDGVTWTMVPQPVRMSLSDAEPAMWGFEVNVLRGDEPAGVKTCFVGRVRVHTVAPEALTAGMGTLAPVLYDIALQKVEDRIRAGAPEDEILFA